MNIKDIIILKEVADDPNRGKLFYDQAEAYCKISYLKCLTRIKKLCHRIKEGRCMAATRWGQVNF